MPITSIFDLIPNCPNPAPINVVPFFDGCNWSLIQIPAGVTCNDVLACFTNNPDFIGTLLTSSNSSIVISGHNIEVSTAWMNANIIATLTGPTGTDLTIGTTVLDLSTIFSNIVYSFIDASGLHMDVGNGDTINLLGIDGMRFFITPANTIFIGLPANRQHMQVLTWDDVNHIAYRENNQCCAQTLSFDTATNILQISGTNAVDLTSINTDNQELAIVGNIFSITQLNSGPQAVDLTNVNEHTLGVIGNDLYIYGSDGLPNGLVADLSHVNLHNLSLNGNMLTLTNAGGDAHLTVDLGQVNQHTLGISGAWTCHSNSLDVVTITIYGSNGLPINHVDIAPPEICCCADLQDCSIITDIQSDIAAQTLLLGSLQDQIDAIRLLMVP